MDEHDMEQDRSYERPRVEAVLTADDLAREIHYAGTPSGGQDG